MKLVDASVTVVHYSENGKLLKEVKLPLAQGSTVEEFFNFHEIDERIYYVSVQGKRPWSNRVLGNGEVVTIQDIEVVTELESAKYFDVVRLS